MRTLLTAVFTFDKKYGAHYQLSRITVTKIVRARGYWGCVVWPSELATRYLEVPVGERSSVAG